MRAEREWLAPRQERERRGVEGATRWRKELLARWKPEQA